MTHISEEKIQEYLDQDFKGLTIDEQAHLEACDKCRTVAEGYKRLFAELREDEDCALSVDFAASTMRQIEALESPVERYSLSNILWIIGAASCVATLIYLLDVKVLLDNIGSYVTNGSMFGSTALSSLKQWVMKFEHGFSILLWAGMIMGGVALVDRMLFRHRPSNVHLMSI